MTEIVKIVKHSRSTALERPVKIYWGGGRCLGVCVGGGGGGGGGGA